ncbi:MAG: adenylate/guanylate cyclase domain-containing protein [Deltaproteobacteria bacterium]|nr:adenylate/guanylate cyclase domain-containing protein [Deltaproteobacteria bacterium]MBW1987169.1 adenylate/guanylate cyclase domain-containing protein [Deltaproteobacteria bacterium]
MQKLTIVEAIELAIAQELQAQYSYLEMSKQTDDPELRNILIEIANEEAGHEASLRSRLRLYKEKNQLRETISRYVSPAVCDELIKNPDLLQLGGRRRQVTVLFADIWGFTAISEQLPPESVVDILNRYFTAMVDLVFEHQGTLDKYLGDNLMAVFGAPLELPQASHRAVECALAMHRRLVEMQEQGEFPIRRIGIGINTGEAIVGNIGSARRMDYTVIGDTVNVAARLQELTRELEADTIIGPLTYQEVARNFQVKACTPVILRGRRAPTPIYQLIDSKG